MTSQTRRLSRLMDRANEAYSSALPWGNAQLIDYEFSPRPVFRMRFDEHVQVFRRVVSERIGKRYNRDASFRTAYDAKELEMRSLPMPAWKEPAHVA